MKTDAASLHKILVRLKDYLEQGPMHQQLQELAVEETRTALKLLERANCPECGRKVYTVKAVLG